MGNDAGRIWWGWLCDASSQAQGHHDPRSWLISICLEQATRKPPFWNEDGDFLALINYDEDRPALGSGSNLITTGMADTANKTDVRRAKPKPRKPPLVHLASDAHDPLRKPGLTPSRTGWGKRSSLTASSCTSGCRRRSPAANAGWGC